MEFEGQVALVTGASRGIGRAVAMRLAGEGAAVAVNYARQAEAAEEAVREIRAAGGQAVALQGLVGNPADAERIVDQAREALGGPVSILVNNAAVLSRGELEDYDREAFRAMQETNVEGVILMIRAVAPAMREQRFGRIVNVTSIAAHGTSLRGTTFYAATKASVELLTRRFAMDLGPHGITVNAVAPGLTITDMVTGGLGSGEAERMIEAVSELAMVRRVGSVDDIAHAVAFLASPRSGFITAQVLTVDGGRMDYVSHA